MADSHLNSLLNSRARGNWVRLRTLIMLRWMAIGGQIAAVLVATEYLGFQLPLSMCAVMISASVTVNIIAQLVHPAEKRLSERGTFLSQFFDLAQLVVMLMLTGGLNNPFAVLVLAPVTIAATALKLTSTVILGVFAMLSVPLMAVVHRPLITKDGTVLAVPEVFLYGIGAGLIIGVVFLSLYARRVTVEVYTMSQALNATQIALSREQRLSAIGGMAAAAAHELGTPLATIKLVAGELADELAGQPALAADVQLIREEAQRCGAIMADLSQGGRDDRQVKRAPIAAIFEEAAEPHAQRGKDIVIRLEGGPASEAQQTHPVLNRTPELIHGLRNVIQNAVDFAATTVWIDAEVDDGILRVAVGDDGPGFSPDLLPRLGEPYVSSRSHQGDEPDDRGGYEGMGLGLFIARTLLERTGAEMSFANGSDAPGQKAVFGGVPASVRRPPGAIIEMLWPEELVVVPTAHQRGPLGANERFRD
ncbi:MAG: ActS/PrrB/RegB family redox-sensitive histidine kinase [Pseudomonadota bacterium]